MSIMPHGKVKKAHIKKDVKRVNPIKQMAEYCLARDSMDALDAGLPSRDEQQRYLIEILKKIPDAENKIPDAENNNNVVKVPVLDRESNGIMETEQSNQQQLTLEEVKTADKNVKRLLQTVNHTKWREPLQELWRRLQSQDQHVKMCHFMIEFFSQSVQHKTEGPTRDHPMEITESPPDEVFCYNSWKSFVCHLGYDITEPDSNRDVRNSSCMLPGKVPKETVEGMGSLLTAMKEIPHEVVASISQLKAEDYQVMEHVVSLLQISAPKGVQQKSKQLLWKRHRTIAKLIGFIKDFTDYRWCNTTKANNNVWLVSVLLNGFHGNMELVELVSQV